MRVLSLLVAVAMLHAGSALAVAFVPDDDATVLERLPTRSDPSLAELKRLQADLAGDRQNPQRAAQVAQRAIEASRAFGDPRFHGQAQAALAPWWSHEAPPAAVLVLRATIKQSLHDFAGALADLDRLIAREPDNVQALLTHATVLAVQGRFDDAKRDCARLAQRVEPLVVTACEALTSSASADADDVYRRLDERLAAPGGHAATRVWAATLAGEIAERRGDIDGAKRQFARALAADSRDGYLKAAYADFLLRQQRAADVVKLLENDTRNDALLLRLALAERQLPDRAQAYRAHRDDLAARFQAARRRGDVLHLREEARFALEVDRDGQR